MHRHYPDPQVLPSPHSRRCDAPQADLNPSTGQSADGETTAFVSDKYDLDVELAGALA